MKKISSGEELRVKIHYDLLGSDVYNKIGVYVSTDPTSKKLLVHFPEFEEWGEFLVNQVERINPGVVSTDNVKFVSRVKKLEYTLLSIAS